MKAHTKDMRPPVIWLDLDNTPHVPFFEPIIDQLRRHGCTLFITARDAFQVCELADAKDIPYTRVGTHHGRNKVLKGLGLFLRAAQLIPCARRQKLDLAISHGSRAQFIACNVLRIPSLLIDDYEHSKYPPLMRPEHVLVPEVIPAESLPFSPGRIRQYPGLKEDVYAHQLRPDPSILRDLGLASGELLMTARPPATEAHYHDRASEDLFVQLMDRAFQAGARVILLPRNRRQGEALRLNQPHWFADGRTVIPGKAVDALNLIWHSDLVVSGGGTMCREAAALGVPVYSVFRGPLGAVDQWLEKQNRLVLLRSRDDVDRKVKFIRRPAGSASSLSAAPALSAVMNAIESVLGEVSREARFAITAPASQVLA